MVWCSKPLSDDWSYEHDGKLLMQYHNLYGSQRVLT